MRLLPALLALIGCHRDPPDVLLVVLDTVRADHVSSYGYARETTPHLDALAAAGTRYTRATSTAGWTSPAHASLFTGLYAVQHGCTQERWTLDPRLDTLAEDLQAAGWDTAAFVGNPVLSARRGFDQGFARYDESWRQADPDAASVAAATAWLAAPHDRRRFGFVNLIGAHAPYDSCGASCGAFGARPEGGPVEPGWHDVVRGRTRVDDLDLPRLVALYDAELKEVDRHLGDLLAAAPDAVVIVVADHGENLGDHGQVDHVFSLYQSITHVPLVTRGLGAGVVDRPAQLVDVHATVRALAGLPPTGDGIDLRALPADRDVLSEYYRPRQALGRLLRTSTPEERARLARWDHRLRTWTSGGYELVWSEAGPAELYALDADPGERTDLAAAQPERVHALTVALAARIAALGGEPAAVTAPEADPETVRALEGLGYLE